MKKYYIPTIKITSFLRENVVTDASGVISQEHIAEVDTLIGNMTPQEYKVRVDSVANILAFTNE